MTLSEANALLLNRNQEISSLSFPKFLRKAKIHFDGDVIHVAGSNGKGETVFYLTRLALAKKHTGVGSFLIGAGFVCVTGLTEGATLGSSFLTG